MTECLNCGAALHGPFCSACGQRAVPPDPSVAELAGDAWQELSGYDGRIAATARGLLRPGFLTREYITGHRARYLSPIRLYLTVSVVYFLAAAAAPATMSSRTGEVQAPGGIRVAVTGSANSADLSPEERAEILASVERAPSLVGPLLRAVATDPIGFRARILTIMPRVFFALLPVFAVIVAIFYRRHRFPTALVFAAHLHAFAFAVFTLSELTKLTGSVALAIAVGVVVMLIFAGYALMALRTVFGGGWGMTLLKGVAIGTVYLIASLPAFAVILAWASVA